MRRPHVIFVALAALLWIALWYSVGCLIYWFFRGG
jgi:hypothetical protein